MQLQLSDSDDKSLSTVYTFGIRLENHCMSVVEEPSEFVVIFSTRLGLLSVMLHKKSFSSCVC